MPAHVVCEPRETCNGSHIFVDKLLLVSININIINSIISWNEVEWDQFCLKRVNVYWYVQLLLATYWGEHLKSVWDQFWSTKTLWFNGTGQFPRNDCYSVGADRFCDTKKLKSAHAAPTVWEQASGN